MDLTLAKDISLLLNGVGVGNSLLLSFLYYRKPGNFTKSNNKLAGLFLIFACNFGACHSNPKSQTTNPN